jgi:hypothetical protein
MQKETRKCKEMQGRKETKKQRKERKEREGRKETKKERKQRNKRNLILDEIVQERKKKEKKS